MASEISGCVEAGVSVPTIEIKIKTMDSQTYTLQVDKQMTVPALKECIASVTGVVKDHQRLICRGKVLKDDQLLSAYHVEDGHTLHLVVREPTASSSQDLPVDSAFDRSSNGNRGQLFQVAPGIVVETFNMPGQGEIGLSDVSRIISAVLGSMGITNTGSSSEIRDQAGDRHEDPGIVSDTTQNVFGIPAGISFGSVQATQVIPDAVATLSQYLGHMRQEFLNNGNVEGNNDGASSIQGSGGASSYSAQSENALPTPASLAELLTTTRQMLNQISEGCLLQLARELENQENLTNSVDRANAQSGALRSGILLQNLGSYFLELGRTVTTLRLGQSPSEAVVNAGPAVFISPSGPNPIMVQPLPFQPGASFGTPLPENIQSASGLTNGLGAGSVPRLIDIQIRRVSPSTPQTEPPESQQSSGQRNSSPVVIGATRNIQPATGISDSPSSNSGPGSLEFLYRLLGRNPNQASGNLSGRTESQVPGDMPTPASTASQQNVGDSAENEGAAVSSSGERESFSRTIEIDVLSTGGFPNDQNSEGQISAAILQFLSGLFPGGEIHVESVDSEGTTAPSGTVTGEEESRVTEEGLFLSRMLQQIMPLISQDPEIEPPREGDTSMQRDDATSSVPVEDTEFRDSRPREDHSSELPNSKRQKME